MKICQKKYQNIRKYKWSNMNRKEELEKLTIEYDKLQKRYGAKELKSIYNGTSKIVVAINGDNYKYFDKPDDILKNEFVSKSNCWGVNYRSHKRVFYLQILIFGDDGRVKSQYIKKSWDGL